MLQQFLIEFILVFGTCNVHMSIVPQSELPKLVDPTLGIERYSYAHYSGNRIRFNREFLSTATRVQIGELAFHEFGHVCLGLGHPPWPWEYTLMNQVVNVVMPDGRNWNELVAELYWQYRRQKLTDKWRPQYDKECNR
jgi:hypothetical protein